MEDPVMKKKSVSESNTVLSDDGSVMNDDDFLKLLAAAYAPIITRSRPCGKPRDESSKCIGPLDRTERLARKRAEFAFTVV
jgi:hypothetical protein